MMEANEQQDGGEERACKMVARNELGKKAEEAAAEEAP